MTYLASLQEETKYKLKGYKFIHTKAELDKLVVDNLSSNKVILTKEFIEAFFVPSGLIDYIDNVKKINSNILIELDLDEDLVTRDKMIYKLKDCRNIDELIMLLGSHEKEVMDTIKYLIDYQQVDERKMLSYSNQVSKLQSTIDTLNKTVEDCNYTIDTEVNNKLSYQSKFHALISRINYQYNAGIDKNKLFQVDKNSYDKILYIKEITRVQFVDTLIYYLKEIMKTLYSMPTRIVVIENYYADGKIPLYPNLVPHHKSIERDVIKGDILMLGMQPNMMKDILQNSTAISLLIVLDRGGYSVPHIVGDNVEILYTVSDIKDIPEGIPMGRVISYSEKTQYIKYIKDFDNLDTTEKISAYSSMQLVKNIIQLIERK